MWIWLIFLFITVLFCALLSSPVCYLMKYYQQYGNESGKEWE